jgi:8-oxo-dGTP pyrophosphatase MutT (NUDIX family)
MSDIHVRGFFRFVNGKNVWVSPHQAHLEAQQRAQQAQEARVPRRSPRPAAEAPGGALAPPRGPGRGQAHPKRDEEGKRVWIQHPHQPTPPALWGDPHERATWTPGSPVPRTLNSVPFTPWKDHPTTDEEWEEVAGQDPGLPEPPLQVEQGHQAAAGVVIEEPDGRVWVIHPTNAFGGYRGTFPKGRVDDHGANLQAAAIREAFEETGLQVEITGWIADVRRSVTTARYYTARRVGGTPSDMGWEAQAVSLVPRTRLYEVLNQPTDHGLAEALGAGPRPAPPPPPPEPDPRVAPKRWSSWGAHVRGLFEDES